MGNNSLSFYDFSGGINTHCTKVLLGNGSKKLFWDDSFNVELYKDQGVKRMAGNKVIFQNAQTSAIIALGQYPADSENFVFAQADGKIYHYNNNQNNAELIWDYGKKLKQGQFCQYLDGIVFVTDCAQGIYYNIGASEKVKSLNAKTKSGEELYANCVCTYASRLWLGCGSTVYFSALGRFDDWESEKDAGYISNFHSSVSKITAIAPYCGALAIYKADEVFLLNGNSSEDFAIVKFADKGTKSPKGAWSCNNKQYFINQDGVFTLSQTGELAQIMMSGNLAQNIKEEFNSCDKTRMDEAIVIPYEKNNQIWFYLPKNDSEFFDEILIYDFRHNCWTKRVQNQKITSATCVFGEIISGNFEGKILQENIGDSFEDEKIEFRFSTPFFHLGKPSERKIVEDFSILIDDVGENRFKFSTTKDYIKDIRTDIERVKISQRNALTWASGDERLDQYSVWGDENSHIIWPKSFECPIDLQIFDSNLSVALHFEGENLGDDFKLIGIEFKELLNDF